MDPQSTEARPSKGPDRRPAIDRPGPRPPRRRQHRASKHKEIKLSVAATALRSDIALSSHSSHTACKRYRPSNRRLGSTSTLQASLSFWGTRPPLLTWSSESDILV